jgi:3-dehydroquinate synthase
MLMSTDQPAGKPGSAGTVHGFSVSFSFPVSFTRGLWRADNTLLVDTVRRLEPERRHRVFVAIDDQVAAARPSLVDDIRGYFAAHADHLALAGDPILVVGGEAAKNDLQYPIDLLRRMNDEGLDRQSFVAVIGGGAVLDLVSFAAAICHRGVRTIRMPTTVLSQADSGVAVKNSVNLFAKKNFVGTFVPPFAVLNDFEFLETLEPRERTAGISEAVKVSLLRDPAFFEYIETHTPELVGGGASVLSHVVRRSAELHLAHICGNGDPFELGSARPLDFGHWAAHKLEMQTANQVHHGEAVAIGMALDILYSVRMGFLGRGDANRILRVLEAVGFRLWDASLLERDRDGGLIVMKGLREFREHLGGDLHITMLRGIGRSFEVTAIDEDAMVKSLQELAARATPSAPASRPVAAVE